MGESRAGREPRFAGEFPKASSLSVLRPDEPIQPIDPAAWVSHSAALTGAFAAYPGSSSMSTITSGTSVTETERE